MNLTPENKEYHERIRRYTNILKDFPDNVHVLEHRAHCRFRYSDWKKAAIDFEQILKARPNDAAIWGYLGQAYIHGRMPDQAVLACTRAIELEADFGGYYMHRGWAYRQLKQWEASIADYTKAVELDSISSRPTAHSAKYLGELYLEMKEYEKAAEAFTIAISKSRYWGSLYALRGKAYIKVKQFEKAIENANAIMDLHEIPWIPVLEQRAFAYKRLGFPEKAEAENALIKRIKTKNKKQSKASAKLNKSYLKRIAKSEREYEQKKKKMAKDIKKYTKAIEVDKIDKESLFKRGVALMEAGEHKNAIKDFNTLLRFADVSPEVYLNRAICYDATNQLKKALSDYDKTLAIDYGLIRAYVKKAEIYRLLGENEKEITAMEKAIDLDLPNIWNHIRLAKLYEENGNYLKAVEHQIPYHFSLWRSMSRSEYQAPKIKKLSAVIDNPQWQENECEKAALYFIRGKTYDKACQYMNAIADYTKAIELKPDMLIAYFYRALANSISIDFFSGYYGRGSKAPPEKLAAIDSMIVDLIQVIKLNNEQPSFHVELGILYNLNGKYKKALVCFNKAMEIDPDYHRVYEERSKSFVGLKQYQAAIDDLSLELTKEGSCFSTDSILERRADIYRKLGEIAKAVEDYSKIIEKEEPTVLETTLAECLEKRGNCYQELGEEEKAKSDFEKAAELRKKGWKN